MCFSSHIAFKSLLQQAWIRGIQWNHPLPDDLEQQWLSMREDLKNLTKLSILRCVIPSKIQKLELHAFCDASELAYATMIYLRATLKNGQFAVQLLT